MINIGIGISWAKAIYSVANNVIANFKARVLADNGVFEAGPCLDATLEGLNAIGLLDNASLIITPNAYNTGILYDVVPNTTLGDMNVVRATTATRVNSEGLIEVVPRNLLTYSEQFDNASWTKVNSTITSNAETAPNGILTADKLIEAATSSEHWVFKSTTNTIPSATISCYMKKGERNWGFIRTRTTVNDFYAWFNLDNGTVGTVQSGITASITDVGNGWYRCVVINSNPTTLANPSVIGVSNANNVFSYLGNGTSGIYIWGAQLEQGSTATEYFPTTTRLNIPRIDYTNGSCPSILVEPQRTNVLTYSEQFGTSWINNGATIISNDTTAPDGNLTADRLTATGGGFGVVKFSTWTATNKVASCFVKANTSNLFRIANVSAGGGSVTFNLSTQAITATTGFTGSIEALPNGWFRCVAIDTLARSGTFSIGVTAISESVFVWGAQLEAGSNATSYIPTQASTVTRNADVISKTGISSLIGQTEGTLFCEINTQVSTDNNGNWFQILDGGTDNWVFIGLSGNKIRAFIRFGAITVFDSNVFVLTNDVSYKAAIAYKNGDLAFYINGFQIQATSTSFTITNPISYLAIGFLLDAANDAAKYKQGVIFKTRLSNTELAQLTTI